MRFELMTARLRIECSTPELHRRYEVGHYPRIVPPVKQRPNRCLRGPTAYSRHRQRLAAVTCRRFRPNARRLVPRTASSVMLGERSAAQQSLTHEDRTPYLVH
jgi:hypothetical protein